MVSFVYMYIVIPNIGPVHVKIVKTNVLFQRQHKEYKGLSSSIELEQELQSVYKLRKNTKDDSSQSPYPHPVPHHIDLNTS